MQPIAVSTEAAEGRAEDGDIVEVTLPTTDAPETVLVHAPDGPARLSDIVPLARALADRIIASARGRLERDGTPVPCRVGCDACCRYLVPISVPEAFRLREEVFALPASERHEVIEHFISASQQVLNAAPPDVGDYAHSPGRFGEGDRLGRIAHWYTSLGVGCPLLHEAACSVYPQRPLVCREYLVTCSPAECRRPEAAGACSVRLPASVAESLAQLAAEVEGTDPEAVILPLALLWTQENRDRGERTWPAGELVSRLGDILARTSADSGRDAA